MTALLAFLQNVWVLLQAVLTFLLGYIWTPLWTCLRQNNKQISSLSQIALVCAGIAGLYKYFHDDRQQQLERIASGSNPTLGARV